jgi:CubicO group peptidase (beta-lactamase class C family)
MRRFFLRIILVYFLCGMLMPSGQNSAEGKVRDQLDIYIEHYLEEYRVPGASVTLVQGGEIYYAKSWGVTGDREEKVTSDTPFTIGSISKSLTGLAVITLIDKGLIKLDDPVKKHLPWFKLKNREAASRITIKQLLTQTSGLGTSTGLSLSDKEAVSDDAIRKSVESMEDVGLSARIGEKHLYSNANFLILGALIEEVTNQRFAEYVQQSVLKPLGMKNAAADRETAYEKGYASGYQSWFGLPRKSDVSYDNGGAPYGYMTASAKDMVKFLSFLSEQGAAEILSERSKELYTSPHVQTGEDRYYGLGIRISNPGSEEEMIWHSGSTPDSHSELFMLPETGWGGVILTNKNNILEEEGLYYLKMGIIDILNGDEPVEIPDNTPVVQTIFLVITCLLAALAIYFIIKMRTRHTFKKGLWGVIGIVFMISAISLIPLLTYFTQSPWHAIRVFSPDVAFLLVATNGLLALNGLLSLCLSFRKVK